MDARKGCQKWESSFEHEKELGLNYLNLEKRILEAARQAKIMMVKYLLRQQKNC